jgi:hypothetical protein
METKVWISAVRERIAREVRAYKKGTFWRILSRREGERKARRLRNRAARAVIDVKKRLWEVA